MASNSMIQRTTLTDEDYVVSPPKNCDLMVTEVKQMIDSQSQFTNEELVWVSIVYKQSVSRRRESWNSMKTALDKEKDTGNIGKVKKAKSLLKDIENEIRFYCNDILHILQKKFIPTATSNSMKVLCYRLMGDYNQYLVELETDDLRIEMCNNVLDAYNAGYELALEQLDAGSHEYLALVLNYSVFVYKTLGNHKKAIEMTIIVRNDVASQINPKSLSPKALDVLKIMDTNMLKWGGLHVEAETDPQGTAKPYHASF
ncbi:14-3-3 protein homolog 2-like [Teleopsis dalmanni]|uniref:14-3-3 protein homolog 2-like n=1 Tax=Teleopsis dalmanni TaxID=139649 RepID=UPI0018CCCF56|nr:14-3-3 protein homolog 2-like [Teleopsis dalmanni]